MKINYAFDLDLILAHFLIHILSFSFLVYLFVSFAFYLELHDAMLPVSFLVESFCRTLIA